MWPKLDVMESMFMLQSKKLSKQYNYNIASKVLPLF